MSTVLIFVAALEHKIILEFRYFYRENCPTLLCIVIKVEHQPSVLESPIAGRVWAEVEALGVEARFKQLAAGQGDVASTTGAGDK